MTKTTMTAAAPQGLGAGRTLSPALSVSGADFTPNPAANSSQDPQPLGLAFPVTGPSAKH